VPAWIIELTVATPKAQILLNTGDPTLLRQLDEPFSYKAEQEQFKPLPRLKSTRKRKEIQVKNTELSQKFGVLAIGDTICREFGFDGIFYGIINAFRREDEIELYTVRYTDGDQEDLDLEEYNFAYALWLQKEGWDVNEDERWNCRIKIRIRIGGRLL
jgi:hypothetical protein